jgi:hypothetical protein
MKRYRSTRRRRRKRRRRRRRRWALCLPLKKEGVRKHSNQTQVHIGRDSLLVKSVNSSSPDENFQES